MINDITNISLNVTNQDVQRTLHFNARENNSRTLKFCFNHNGRVLKLTGDEIISFYADIDGEKIYKSCYIEDGLACINFVNSMLPYKTEYEASIKLQYKTDIMYSPKIKIVVEEPINNDEAVEALQSFDTLEQLIIDADDAIDDMEELISTVEQKLENGEFKGEKGDKGDVGDTSALANINLDNINDSGVEVIKNNSCYKTLFNHIISNNDSKYLTVVFDDEYRDICIEMFTPADTTKSVAFMISNNSTVSLSKLICQPGNAIYTSARFIRINIKCFAGFSHNEWVIANRNQNNYLIANNISKSYSITDLNNKTGIKNIAIVVNNGSFPAGTRISIGGRR